MLDTQKSIGICVVNIKYEKQNFLQQVRPSNGVLVLENVSIDDAGWYACFINGTKSRIMTGAKLDVDKSMHLLYT